MRRTLGAMEFEHLRQVWQNVSREMHSLDEWRAKKEGRPPPLVPRKIVPPEYAQKMGIGIEKRPHLLETKPQLRSRPQSARARPPAPPAIVSAQSGGTLSQRPRSAQAACRSAPSSAPQPPQQPQLWFDRNWAAVEIQAKDRSLQESLMAIENSEATVEALRSKLTAMQAKLSNKEAALKSSEQALAASRAAWQAERAAATKELEAARDETANIRAARALTETRLDDEIALRAEEKQQLFARQLARQIASHSCLRAFASWQDFWQARSHSMQLLRHAANRIRTCQLAGAFYDLVAERDEALLLSEMGAHEQQTTKLQQLVEAQQAESAQLQETLSTQLKELGERAEDQALTVAEKEDLKAELLALRAELEVQQQASSAKIDELAIAREKELMALAAKVDSERVERFQRAAVRRLHNRDLSAGFNAWLDFQQAKVHALSRLRQCANRINPRTRELARAFAVWAEDATEAGRTRQLLQLERRVAKLIGLMTIRDKEITWLKAELQRVKPREENATAEKLRKQREKMRKKAGHKEY